MKSNVVPVPDVLRASNHLLPFLVAMSRRKQSNPKPLKREDEEDSPQPGDAPSNVKSEPTSNPCSPGDTTRSSSPAPPRVRLNVSLATDPGQSAEQSNSAAETTPPPRISPSVAPSTHPHGLEYLAALQPAFQHALATGRLFPSLPETDLSTLAKPAPVRPKSEQSVETRAVPLYLCAPCGIRFSSASTLEAHQTYYCSHRVQAKRESDVDEPKSPGGEESASSVKSARTGKQYGCPHCSYSADKKVSLNRHMRMHAASPVPANGTTEPAPSDRYCHDCDIRFSSVKTLKAHKLHYCGSRHGKVTPPDKTSSSPVSPTSPRVSPESQQFLVLPTDPVLIVPYSLVQSASVMTGGASLPRRDTACVILHDGTVQPMSELVPTSDEAILRLRGERNARRDVCLPASPLDLTVRRASDTDVVIDEDEKENVFSSSSHEDIVCAPSIPTLLAADKVSPCRKSDYSTSPSPPSPMRKSWKSPNGLCKAETEKVDIKREPSTDRLPLTTPSPELLPGTILPLVSELRVGGIVVSQPAADVPVPQVLVKQGVSKCQECNIVFCKHENYIAHKKHYCSSRSVDPVEDSSRNSPQSQSPGSTKDPTESKSPGPTKPATLYQFICVACGIKFTALDNLTAHQAYYCPKRSESAKTAEEKPRKCAKCKNVVTGDHQCTSPLGWKCPCCSVISQTAAAAQKHMEVHTGVKAFRCTICRYKGNTLRGMRTHIRMHFDKKNSDLQEENFITCIVEDEVVVNGDLPALPAALPPLSSPVAVPAMAPVVIKQEAVEDELVDVEADPVPPASPTPSDPVESTRRSTLNYCQTCDITFTYPASFRAHKQFYCSTNARTRSPRTVTPETSVQ